MEIKADFNNNSIKISSSNSEGISCSNNSRHTARYESIESKSQDEVLEKRRKMS